jgi:glutaconyl-CoA/methylmalonyl-CoA decarboxylase subunit gamma
MRQYNLTISDNDYNVIIKEVTNDEVLAEVNGVEHRVLIRKINKLVPKTKPTAPIQDVQPVTSPSAPQPPTPPSLTAGEKAIVSPIPGHILEVSVSIGDKVLRGQKVLILEAMKMENVITATVDGIISKILVSEGDAVTHAQQLIIIE